MFFTHNLTRHNDVFVEFSWKGPVPPKVKVFVWIAFLSWLIIKDMFQARRSNHSSSRWAYMICYRTTEM